MRQALHPHFTGEETSPSGWKGELIPGEGQSWLPTRVRETPTCSPAPLLWRQNEDTRDRTTFYGCGLSKLDGGPGAFWYVVLSPKENVVCWLSDKSRPSNVSV